MKLFVPKDKLVSSGQGWAQDFTPTNIRLIGVAEVLGAVGLILPAVTHIAPILVPLAAIGLVLVMVGAAVVHARRNEAMNIGVNAVLLALAAFVAWGRFRPYAVSPLTLREEPAPRGSSSHRDDDAGSGTHRRSNDRSPGTPAADTATRPSHRRSRAVRHLRK